jgi:hypothetical protein
MSAFSNMRAMAVLAATGALLLAAFAAAPQAEASTLYACVAKGGNVKVYTKAPKCKKHETRISWNSVGPAGPAGKNGTNGTNGSNGINGTNGAVAGYSAVQSKGIAFTKLESNQANTLILSKSLPAGSYIASGSVTLTASQAGKNGEGGSALTTYVDMSCTMADTPVSGSAVSDTSFWSGFTNIPVIIIAIGNGSLSFNMAITTTTASTATITCTNILNDGSNTSPSAFAEEASGAVITAVQTSSNS